LESEKAFTGQLMARQAGQAAGLPASFLELFSFRQRKKWNVPLEKGKNHMKSPVCAQKRNTLFILKIYRVGKILSFSHSIRRHFSAALRRFFML
jgi:hypothetical protein